MVRPRPAAAAIPIAILLTVTACSSAPAPPPSGHAEIGPGRPDGTELAPTDLADRVAASATTLIATPYRNRGNSPEGFDCSGLTEFVFASVGISIPRTAAGQADEGLPVPDDEIRKGDLLFFGSRGGKLHHVGIVVSDPGEPWTMIHASSSRGVVRSRLTPGSYWLQRFLFGRRVLGED